MRRLLFAAVLGLWTLGLAAPASAQDDPTIGSTGPASGEFAQTDEACGFGDFTDGSYTATIGEDADGVYIEFTQGSTGDSGRFRSDGDGNISFETDGDEEYNDIRVDGNRLIAQYLYGTDCVQEWSATVELPEGFIDFLVAASAAPEPQPEPVPEPEPEPEAEDPPAEIEEPQPDDVEAGTDDGGAAAPTDAAGGESTDADGSSDDGGIDWESLTFLALLLLFLIALFLLYRRRQQRLYRADPGDFGEFIPVPPGGDDDDEPAETSPGPPGIIADDGEDPPGAVPPPTGDCIPEREEFELAQEAKDAAFAAGEQADRELAAAKDAHGRLEAATSNPLGADPPQLEADPGGSESERAQAARVHALQVAEWERFEQEAIDAAAALPDAEATLDKARADRAEAWEDFQRMRRRLEAARVALNNCDGSAGPPDDDDQPPGPETGAGSEPESAPAGGTSTGGGQPGVIADPPAAEPPPAEEDTCPEGAEKDGEAVSSHEFRAPGGPITVDVGTSAWARHGRTFNPEAFEELDTDLVEELSAGIEQERTAVRISVRIPTTIVTVECVAILVCRSNAWIDSGRRKRVESRAPGPDLQVLPTGAAGGVARSKDRRDAGRMVEKAQALLAELRENEDDAAEVDCE